MGTVVKTVTTRRIIGDIAEGSVPVRGVILFGNSSLSSAMVDVI